MSDVTQILSQMENGDPEAAEKLLPLVYDQLREMAGAQMAREAPEHTLQATALVHEAYVRLVDTVDAKRFRGRQHFLAVAALAMRRILVDWARKKGTLKRGSSLVRIDLERFEPMLNTRPDVVLAIDETLSQLAVRDPEAAKVAELRLFSELTFEEIALSLSISRSQANRHWLYARAVLHNEVGHAT